jgi:hypothetical protein
MSTASVIVDDFESIIQYSKNVDYYTPDPSDPAVVQNEKCVSPTAIIVGF